MITRHFVSGDNDQRCTRAQIHVSYLFVGCFLSVERLNEGQKESYFLDFNCIVSDTNIHVNFGTKYFMFWLPYIFHPLLRALGFPRTVDWRDTYTP